MIAALVPVLAVPVRPDGDEARRLLLDELAKGPYQAARPTLFDLAAQAFLDWFQSLFSARGSAAPPVLLVVALVVVVGVVVVALVLFGLPRLNRRGTAAAALFGDEDRRTADQLRRAADDAMRAGDWSRAVLERFRAIARGLDERTLVAVFPGTTATGFARSAGTAFPVHGAALTDAAALFDRVRYADLAAARADAEAVADLDRALAAAQPVLQEAGA